MNFFIFLLTVLPYAKALSPSFVENELHVAAPIGRDAELNCTVRHVQNYKVAWIDTAREVVLSMEDQMISDNPKFSIRHTSSTSGFDSFLLTIRGVSYADEGTFMCQINTKEAKTRVYNLSVVVSPSIIDAESSGDIEEAEGGRVTLKCKAKGIPKPEITWIREKTPDTDATIRRYGKMVEEIKGEQLIFTDIQRKDAGTYFCIARNGVQPAVSKRIRLNVKFIPMITMASSNTPVYIGEQANISCVIDSWPKPYVLWTREDSAGLLNRHKFQTSLRRNGSTKYVASLYIREVLADDIRLYRCIINNTEGQVEASIKLVGQTQKSPRLVINDKFIPQHSDNEPTNQKIADNKTRYELSPFLFSSQASKLYPIHIVFVLCLLILC